MSKVSDEAFEANLREHAIGYGAHVVGVLLIEAADRIQSLRSASTPTKAVRVTDEMVERGHKAQMSELFLRCQPDRGDVFSFMDHRKDVMRLALTAALSALEDAPHP